MKKIIAKLLSLGKKRRDHESSGFFAREFVDYSEVMRKPAPSREDLLQTLNTANEVLKSIGCEYWVARGTIMGLYRQNNFLPNERDIDIDLYSEKDVYKIIRKMPFDILRITVENNRYMDIAFYDKATNVILDIIVYHDKNEKLENRNDYGYFWYPKEIKSKLARFEFKGCNFPVPADLEWYCAFWFGDNWRTPQSYGLEWWWDYQKNCKAFIYTGDKDNKGVYYY